MLARWIGMTKTPAPKIPPIRIAIVEDHMLVRKSMMMLINTFDGMQVVLEADNGTSFIEKTAAGTPFDIVLLDIQMPVMNGFEVCKYLLKFFPEVKILFVSQLTTKQTVQKIIEKGGHGYFSKNSPPEDLAIAIRCLYDNGYYFELELKSVLHPAISDNKKAHAGMKQETLLTDRELQVITLMCNELSSHEIAAQLFISVRSVEAHRRSIMEKTCSQNLIGIVLYALRRNLISIDGF